MSSAHKDYSRYEEEHKKYKDLTKNLFWFQKFKSEAWIKGENFGDYLSKVVVGEVAKKLKKEKMYIKDSRLLAIGSILHFARDNDTIWGSGINGKISYSELKFDTLDIRSVRGPLSRDILKKEKNIEAPAIYGDPALLLPYLFPNLQYAPIKNKIILIPNLNEYEECKKIDKKDIKLVSPYMFWTDILKEILSSEIVLTSSLHGLIVSEAFGVAVRLFKPFGGETMFKYEDYLEGTGRSLSKMPKSFKDGVEFKNGVAFKQLDFDNSCLIESFPDNIFKEKDES